MKLEIRHLRTLPSEKSHLRTYDMQAGQLKRDFGISTDVAVRIVSISRTMDQAHAIAELMK